MATTRVPVMVMIILPVAAILSFLVSPVEGVLHSSAKGPLNVFYGKPSSTTKTSKQALVVLVSGQDERTVIICKGSSEIPTVDCGDDIIDIQTHDLVGSNGLPGLNPCPGIFSRPVSCVDRVAANNPKLYRR